MNKKLRNKVKTKENNLVSPVRYLGHREGVENQDVLSTIDGIYYDAFPILNIDENEYIQYTNVFNCIEQDLINNKSNYTQTQLNVYFDKRFMMVLDTTVYSLFNSVISNLSIDFEFIDNTTIKRYRDRLAELYYLIRFSLNFSSDITEYLNKDVVLDSYKTTDIESNNTILSYINNLSLEIYNIIFRASFETFVGYFEEEEFTIFLSNVSDYVASFHDSFNSFIYQLMMEYVKFYSKDFKTKKELNKEFNFDDYENITYAEF